MPDLIFPPERRLTSTGARARAAGMMAHLRHEDLPLAAAVYLADAVDAASAAILAVAGLNAEQSREVMAALWADR